MSEQFVGFATAVSQGGTHLMDRLLRGLGITLLFVIAAALTVWFLGRVWRNLGTVFNSWDSLISWNTWAQTWAGASASVAI